MPAAVRSLTAVDVGELSLERFADTLDGDEFARVQAGILRSRDVLAGRRVINVNSTARGGGVAEMLVTLLAYARAIGVDASWQVIGGDDAFFAITKRIHNHLHGFAGDGGALGAAEAEVYRRSLAAAGEQLRDQVRAGDVVILHDPQTAGLIDVLRPIGATIIWRCHVGVDAAGDLAHGAWRFLEPWVSQADATIFSRAGYAWDVLPAERIHVVTPTIDAFSPKNQELDRATSRAILVAAGLIAGDGGGVAPAFAQLDGTPGLVSRRARLAGDGSLPADARVVLQVSRWDALKDPLGVIDGFARHIADHTDAHLVYAGPAVEAVADDPEGIAVLAAARDAWAALPPALQQRVHLAMLPMEDLQENAAIVNALQRHADVVVQKSIAEGFGLTVAEAMWKRRAVVASRIGGIQDQIEHGVSGVLLDDPRDLAAYGGAVVELLGDPAKAQRIGAAAHERVGHHFLGPHSLLAYLELIEQLLHD